MFVITSDWDKLDIYELQNTSEEKERNIMYSLIYFENRLINLSELTTHKFYNLMIKRFNAIHVDTGLFSYLAFNDRESAQKVIDWFDSVSLYKELNK